MTQVMDKPQSEHEAVRANSTQSWLPSVSESIARLIPYRPGKPVAEVERELGITGIIKLASNENALGPSPRAVAAIQHLAAKMHLYPDAGCHDLRLALAAHHDIAPECLVFGNGSDDIIHLLGVTFLQPGDNIVQADPSFVRYEAAALLNNAECRRVPLLPNWEYDLDALARAVDARTRLVFLTNCNNPTGTIITREQLTNFVGRMPADVIIVLDEAYYEYGADAPEYPDSIPYVRDGRNVVVLRTFSKAYGLAGFRIGYGLMRPEIAAWLDRTREPFNVNTLAQAAAVAALGDQDHVRQTVAMNEAGKRAFYAAFDQLELPYTLTYGNFVWFNTRRDGQAVFNALLHQGVITRFSHEFRSDTHLRVTIGTEAENTKFLHALQTVLPELPLL